MMASGCPRHPSRGSLVPSRASTPAASARVRNARVVQERLGHSTIAITLGIYSHVAPTLHDEAALLVADLVMPSP